MKKSVFLTASFKTVFEIFKRLSEVTIDLIDSKLNK